MSRLLRILRPEYTGNYRPAEEWWTLPTYKVEDITEPSTPYKVTRDYEVSVRWKRTFTCAEGDLDLAMRDVYRDLNHAVYSDAQLILRRLEMAYAERNRDKFESALRDMRTELHEYDK